MIKFNIKEPIWAGRKVGIARHKIKEDILVSIDYKTTSGLKLFPDRYFMKKEKALKYPLQAVKGGVILSIIPIDDFEIYQEKETV